MNQLRVAIATVIELASQMIDELDEETMAALSDLIQAATERLARQAQDPTSELGNQPPADNPRMERPMPSSNVHSFGYDDKTGRLLVKFQGDYPDQNGPVYGYEGVPKNIFNLFQAGAIPARTDGQNRWGRWWKGKVPSLGASLYTLIRNGGYPYQRLT